MVDGETSKKAVVTYESLYELVRREKMKQELTALEPDFIPNFLSYVKDKDKEYDEASGKDDFFSVSERDKLQTQLQNIKRLFRELFDRREKKIIEMAENRSKLHQDIVDTTNLTAFERTLYETLVATMTAFREEILNLGFGIVRSSKKEQARAASNSISATKIIRFLTETPQFIGSSLEPYGPFEQNQTATLPTDVADVLISQGSAVEIPDS